MQKMLDYFPGCVCQLALRLPHRDKGQKNETSRKACIAMFLSTEAEIEDHRISKMPLGRCNDAWSDYGDRSQLGKSLKGEHQKRNTAPPQKNIKINDFCIFCQVSSWVFWDFECLPFHLLAECQPCSPLCRGLR